MENNIVSFCLSRPVGGSRAYTAYFTPLVLSLIR